MTTLPEFLLARIEADEAAARAAIDPERPGTRWVWEAPDDRDGPDDGRWLRTVEEFPTTSGVGPLPAFPLGVSTLEPRPSMAHIARHDPARVLAECRAKRAIVELHADIDPCDAHDGSTMLSIPCDTLRALVQPYADHEDFDAGWLV